MRGRCTDLLQRHLSFLLLVVGANACQARNPSSVTLQEEYSIEIPDTLSPTGLAVFGTGNHAVLWSSDQRWIGVISDTFSIVTPQLLDRPHLPVIGATTQADPNGRLLLNVVQSAPMDSLIIGWSQLDPPRRISSTSVSLGSSAVAATSSGSGWSILSTDPRGAIVSHVSPTHIGQQKVRTLVRLEGPATNWSLAPTDSLPLVVRNHHPFHVSAISDAGKPAIDEVPFPPVRWKEHDPNDLVGGPTVVAGTTLIRTLVDKRTGAFAVLRMVPGGSVVSDIPLPLVFAAGRDSSLVAVRRSDLLEVVWFRIVHLPRSVFPDASAQ